jgi:hypothetical protein
MKIRILTAMDRFCRPSDRPQTLGKIPFEDFLSRLRGIGRFLGNQPEKAVFARFPVTVFLSLFFGATRLAL